MASKIKPALTPEDKKRIAYARKKGVLIVVIIALSLLIVVELGFLVAELIKLAA